MDSRLDSNCQPMYDDAVARSRGICHNYRIIFIDAAHAQQFRAMWSCSFSCLACILGGCVAASPSEGQKINYTDQTDFMHYITAHEDTTALGLCRQQQRQNAIYRTGSLCAYWNSGDCIGRQINEELIREEIRGRKYVENYCGLSIM